jgi:hypothetical protein
MSGADCAVANFPWVVGSKDHASALPFLGFLHPLRAAKPKSATDYFCHVPPAIERAITATAPSLAREVAAIMADNKELKAQGVRFARSLQMLVKMVNMFSADHKSAADMLRRSYDLLNPLVKRMRFLTIGFVERRVLLNNILTSEESLKPLENEFLKRGIGAVSFDAGITLAAFTRAIAAIAASPKLIEEAGGLMPFLESRQLEFVRVFPAVKNEVRNEDGDTVLEMGSEEYLISKALNNLSPAASQGVEAILGHLGLGQSEVAVGNVGNAAATAEAGVGFGGNGSGGGPLGGGSARGSGNPGGRDAAGGYLSKLQEAAELKFESSLANPREDPQEAYLELGKILKRLRPDAVLSNLAGAAEAGALKEEVTAEVFEETALRWALKRLAGTPTGEDAVVVEEQVFRVLMRSLQATHAASRLAQKLSQFAKDYVLPKATLDRLEEEVRWLTLTPQAKLRNLLSCDHFSAAEFRRAMDLLKDLIRVGNHDEAVALAIQYFSIFENHGSIRVEEVGRIPELLRGLSGLQNEFWTMAEERLAEALNSAQLNQLIHVQVVNALVALARIAATYEDFALVKKIGSVLETSAARNATVHSSCCRSALILMLQVSAVDRVVEIYLEKRNDSEWTRTVTVLLRWADSASIERVFARLDKDPVAANRLALIRLLARVGPAGWTAGRERLKRPEWYVVRNACKLLAELKDPELLQQMLPVFQHDDERVQKAALQAVKDSRLPDRKRVLAKVLPLLPQALLEEALGELAFQADPEIVTKLEEYFAVPTRAGGRARLSVVHLLAAIPQAAATEALARISLNQKLEESVRRYARQALERRPINAGNGSSGSDPLVAK